MGDSDIDFDFWAIYPDDPEELEDKKEMRVLIGVEPVGEEKISEGMIARIMSLNPGLRRVTLVPCTAIHCEQPMVEDSDEQDQNDEKVQTAMDDFMEAKKIEHADPRMSINIEKYDDEKGVVDIYSNIGNF